MSGVQEAALPGLSRQPPDGAAGELRGAGEPGVCSLRQHAGGAGAEGLRQRQLADAATHLLPPAGSRHHDPAG